MSRYMGIDGGLTSPAVVVICDGAVVFSEAIKTDLKGIPRYLFIREIIKGLIEVYNPLGIGIEDFAYSQSHQAHQLGWIGGAIREEIYKAGYSGFLEPSTGQVKQFASGKGNTKKEFMVLEVYKRWGVEFKTHDEADAYAVARIVEAVDEYRKDPTGLEPSKLTQIQLEVVLKVLGIVPTKKKKGKGKGKGAGKGKG
ncbi:MAG: hypothetical protein ACYDG6_06835 [Thermincolia bacterium]